MSDQYVTRRRRLAVRTGVAAGAVVSAATAVIAPAAAHACEPTTMPHVRYDPTPAAEDEVLQAGLWPETSGYYHNSWIADQNPQAGTPLCKGDTVHLRTSRTSWHDAETPTP